MVSRLSPGGLLWSARGLPGCRGRRCGSGNSVVVVIMVLVSSGRGGAGNAQRTNVYIDMYTLYIYI